VLFSIKAGSVACVLVILFELKAGFVFGSVVVFQWRSSGADVCSLLVGERTLSQRSTEGGINNAIR
jgi:hypothetical protein